MNSQIKILHLETSTTDALVVDKELKKAGLRYKKKVVTNEPSFIKALIELNPDMIILNHSLPSFSSVRAQQLLKRSRLDIPFILLTASEESSSNTLNKGASDYVSKDHIEKLPAAIINAIERHKHEARRKDNLEQIIKSRELMQEVERLAHFGTWTVSLKDLTVKCSEEAARILGDGYMGKGFSVKRFLLRLDQKDAKQVKKEIINALATAINFLKLNFRIYADDGSVKYIAAALVITRNEEREAIRMTGFCQDISEHKRSEQELKASRNELRNLAAHLQNVREEERASIAREIHDGLGQQLICLKMDMSFVSKKIGKNHEMIKEKIEGSIILLNKTIDTVRKIATELHPSILDNLGVVDAIQWQSYEFEKRSGIKVDFICEFPYVMQDRNIITGLFRIYQESLTNIAKYAEASRIVTKLECQSDQMILNIRDNGKGFDILKIQRERTLGILSMRERTAMLGGKFIITSAIGKGTSILVSIPYTQT